MTITKLEGVMVLTKRLGKTPTLALAQELLDVMLELNEEHSGVFAKEQLDGVIEVRDKLKEQEAQTKEKRH
jgi:hypothetical protein